MVAAASVEPCSAATPVSAPEICGLKGARASVTPIFDAAAIRLAEAARGWPRIARSSASARVIFFAWASASLELRSNNRKAERILISTGLFPRYRLDDGGVLHFYQSVGNQFAKRGKKRLGRFLALDELDPDRKMFTLRHAALGGVHAVMGAKSGLRADQGGAGHAVLLEKKKDLVI